MFKVMLFATACFVAAEGGYSEVQLDALEENSRVCFLTAEDSESCETCGRLTGKYPIAGITVLLAESDYFQDIIKEPELIQPSEREIKYMAKVIHGEAGICDDLQKSAVAWCVCNRVDSSDYPNDVISVITQKSQFKGYSSDKKPTDREYEIAKDVLVRWLNGLEGRTLPSEYLYFHSDHKGKNIFTTNHKKGKVWDWSLPNIYLK